MSKKILFFICLSSTFLLQAQTQITSLQTEAYQSPNKQIFEWEDRVFYAFENGMGKVEIWELANQQLSKIYETPFVLCDFDLNIWSVYQDKLFMGGYYSFRSISFLTGEMMEEIFSNEPYFFSSVRYEFDENLVRAKFSNTVTYLFDMDLNELVPVFVGDLVYKSATAYYYIGSNGNNRVLKKRPFFETASSEIGPGFSNYSANVSNDVLYFQGEGTPLYRIYPNDVFDTFSNFSFLTDLYLGEGGQFWGIDRTASTGGVLHVIDSSSMDILSSKNASAFVPLHIYFANSEKVFFRSLGSNVARLTYWDVSQDTIRLVDTNPYIYNIQVKDSLLFNVTWDYQNPKMDVINTHSLAVNSINLPPNAQNEFRGVQQLFKKEDSYYLALYDLEKGFGFMEYDDQNNILAAGNEFLIKNLGTGTTIANTDNTLYLDNFDQYSRSIQVYDSTASDGIYIHEVVGTLDKDIKAINGAFYYYADHEFAGNPPSDSNYLDLIRFDPQTKTTSILVEALACPPRDFINMEVAGPYIVSPNQWTNENIKVYDTENDILRSISPQQREIIRRAQIVTDNWIYALTSNSGVRKIYKMQIDDLDNIELIYENATETPKLIPIKGDIIHFLVTDALFSYDGQNLVNYFTQPETTFFQGSTVSYQSADKQYVAYKFSTPDSLGVLFYDRLQDEVKTFRVYDFLTLFADNHDLFFGENDFYYRDRNSNQEYELWSYNIATQEQTVQSFDAFPIILSLHGGEVHIEQQLDNRIAVYTADLELIEEVPIGGLLNFWNYYNYPLGQMLNNPRVIYSDRPTSTIQSHYRLLNLYDAKTRTVNTYFDCDSGLRLHSLVQRGATIYCVASNDEDGNQIYQLDIDDYISSAKKDELALNIESLRLFPNPVQDILYLGQRLDHIQIVDIQGKVIYSSKEALESILVDHISPGFYVIKGQHQHQNYIGKFIKR